MKCLLSSSPARLLFTSFTLWSFSNSAFAAISPEQVAATVILDQTGVKNLQIETVEAEEVDFDETVFALGRIKVAPGHRAIVSCRVSGRVSSVAVHPDSSVEKGAEVAVIESRQPGEPPPSIRLFAPLSGRVSTVNIALGQPVSPDDSLVEILDLTEVDAVAAVPEHLAGKLHIGQTAEIRVIAVPGQIFTAKLAHLGTEGDAKNGTVEATFHLENPQGLLRPDLRAEFSIVISKRAGVISIPRIALQGDALNHFVYVKDYEIPFAFVKSPVEIGATSDRFIEVTNGLVIGDEIVTKGAYSLAFAGKGIVSLKEALDAAHGHEHNDDGSELTSPKKPSRQPDSLENDHSHRSGSFSYLTLLSLVSNGFLITLLAVKTIGQRPRNHSPIAPPPTE